MEDKSIPFSAAMLCVPTSAVLLEGLLCTSCATLLIYFLYRLLAPLVSGLAFPRALFLVAIAFLDHLRCAPGLYPCVLLPATRESSHQHSPKRAVCLTTAAGGTSGPSQTATAPLEDSRGQGRQNTARNAQKPARNLVESDGEASDEDDKSDPEKHGLPGPRGAADAENRPVYACPWYLFDPDRYHHCLQYYRLKTFRHVLEHCKRCHTLPKYYCPRCWAKFKNSLELSAHDLGVCEEVPGPEELDESEIHLLRTSSRLDPEGRYFQLWDNVFKGYPRPNSPYVKPGMAEPVKVLPQQLQPWLQENVPGLLQRYGIGVGEDVVQPLIHDLVDIVSAVPSSPRRYRRRPRTPPPPDEPGSAGSVAAVEKPKDRDGVTFIDFGDYKRDWRAGSLITLDNLPASHPNVLDLPTNPLNTGEEPVGPKHSEEGDVISEPRIPAARTPVDSPSRIRGPRMIMRERAAREASLRGERQRLEREHAAEESQWLALSSNLESDSPSTSPFNVAREPAQPHHPKAGRAIPTPGMPAVQSPADSPSGYRSPRMILQERLAREASLREEQERSELGYIGERKRRVLDPELDYTYSATLVNVDGELTHPSHSEDGEVSPTPRIPVVETPTGSPSGFRSPWMIMQERATRAARRREEERERLEREHATKEPRVSDPKLEDHSYLTAPHTAEEETLPGVVTLNFFGENINAPVRQSLVLPLRTGLFENARQVFDNLRAYAGWNDVVPGKTRLYCTCVSRASTRWRGTAQTPLTRLTDMRPAVLRRLHRGPTRGTGRAEADARPVWNPRPVLGGPGV